MSNFTDIFGLRDQTEVVEDTTKGGKAKGKGTTTPSKLEEKNQKDSKTGGKTAFNPAKAQKNK